MAGVTGGETTGITVKQFALMSRPLVNRKSSLEVGNKITLVTFKLNFVMDGLNMLFKVDFLCEFLLANFTLKLYSFMKSLLMES